MAFELAPFSMADYAEALALWQTAEGIGLSDVDSPEGIRSYLHRNPGMSFVARCDGALTGAVLCGHDGRRGYLHHLAVAPAWRGQGIGRGLVDGCLQALRSAGIRKCHLFVFNANPAAFSFWRHIGWTPRADLAVVSREIPAAPPPAALQEDTG